MGGAAEMRPPAGDAIAEDYRGAVTCRVMATVSDQERADAPGQTHEVFNQAPPFEGVDLYSSNVALVEAVQREGAGWVDGQAREVGVFAGSAEAIELGRLANENVPVLRTHDRFGNRIDEVDYHPAYHRFMERSISHGLHCIPWTEERPGAHAARAATFMTMSQAEGGHGCPISMTYAAVPTLRKQPELAAEWEPRLFSRVYDARHIPPAGKDGVTCGMSFTEKQGGSDLRANTTTARATNRFAIGAGGGGAGGEYELTGHKWFCSAPMSDLFLITAVAEEGLSCFLLPRILPDGTRNRFNIQRLKDKLGNRSNASAEIELDGAWAQMVGEPGRGVATVVEMINHTRLDCVLGSASGMRLGVAIATHHCAGRSAFGKPLIEQPLMRNVLADLCVESEAATITAMRLARAYDEAETDEHEALFKRVATAVGKYWTCKRGPAHAAEALECLGGNGYVEESGMPRLYREMPVNSAWEGSGNVMCLDVLRALAKQPSSLDAFFDELELARGAEQRLDSHVQRLKDNLSSFDDIQCRARRIVEDMALALQGSLLVRHGAPAVADAFCASRLGGDGGLEYGTLPAGTDFEAIITRNRVQV
jgi:putative acyl-CoA dehydrogenase